MTDQTNQTQLPTQPQRRGRREIDPEKMIRVDIVNPLRGGRGIDRGDKAHSPLYIAAGETKYDVEISEWVAADLLKRTRNNAKPVDLLVYEAGKAPAPKSAVSEETEDEDEDADDAE